MTNKNEPTITAKAWNPDLESEIRKKWQDDATYEFVIKEKGQNYTIDTPPPYPSGRPWHIGAAAHYSQIDMIARTARMAGKNVYFPIGIDRNGLPVEIYTEKKHNIRMRETDRKEFLELCRVSLDELESEMVEIMDGLGLSGDTTKRYRTDTPEYRALTQATFIKMWKDGNIYLANRPNNYDWVSGTTIADAEIVYEEIASKLVYMKFALVVEKRDDLIVSDDDNNSNNENIKSDNLTSNTTDTTKIGEHIIIASTRPELLCACKTVIVNPEDKRYEKYVGKTVRVPITNQEVKVRAHHSAKSEFGSGAVMVCSYGDQNDVALFRELKLKEVSAIGIDGRMTSVAGPQYAGLRPKQSRVKIIKDLQKADLINKIEDVTHRTPVAERSRNPIEIIPMEEYYMKQMDHIEKIRDMAEHNITFHPPMHKQVLFNWLESINMDWPISRRRYYSTEIPIWHCRKCKNAYVPEAGKYYRPWEQECPAKQCSKCGASDFVGEERTFDTWMDSSISPLFVCGYGRDDKMFEKMYPTSIRPQAKDIIRTWLYYTLLRCDKITGKPPWSEAWIMGYGLDEHGLKMSKSKGNAIDPLPVIRRLGADTFRFWNASEVNHGYDFRCNEQKIESAKKFLSKLWNVSRFLSSFEVPKNKDGELSSQQQNNNNEKTQQQQQLQHTDRWILSELDTLIKECHKGYAEYNFFIPAIAIREFTWNVFAAHYIEMVKGRAYGIGFSDKESQAAIHTLHFILNTILRLLAPITPFITEYLWQKLYATTQDEDSTKSIHKERQPVPNENDTSTSKEYKDITKSITEFNSTVWNEKKSKNLSLKEQINIKIPDTLKPFEKDLCAMHNIDYTSNDQFSNDDDD